MKMPTAVVARNGQNEPLVTLQGDVDFHNAHYVRQALQMAGGVPGDAIVVDLEAVSFIDSSGLSSLVAAARDLRQQGRWLRLERASRHLVQLFQNAGFSRYFQVASQLTPGGMPPVPERNGGKIWQHAAFRVPARARLVSHIRARVTELVSSIPVDEECLDNICLAVGEAASNAVRHGCQGNEEFKVGVECSTDGETLVVEITDPGPGFDPDAVPIPATGELQEGGMGIYFMKVTMDEVSYSFQRGTTVRLVKRLTALSDNGAAPDGSLSREGSASLSRDGSDTDCAERLTGDAPSPNGAAPAPEPPLDPRPETETLP